MFRKAMIDYCTENVVVTDTTELNATASRYIVQYCIHCLYNMGKNIIVAQNVDAVTYTTSFPTIIS